MIKKNLIEKIFIIYIVFLLKKIMLIFRVAFLIFSTSNQIYLEIIFQHQLFNVNQMSSIYILSFVKIQGKKLFEII